MRASLLFVLIAALALGIRAAAQTTAAGAAASRTPNVEFDLMTWPEVKKAIQEGKTTALVYNGGTEQRGPQNVNGGHTLMARETVRAIAVKLGNAIAAPVLPFSPNRASAELPGTIGLTNELFLAINEQVAEELIKTGFKNVVLMGDHGGGQQQLGEVATKLTAKYSTQGIKVVFCDEVYAKANGDFDKWLQANGYPTSSHAGIPDTSEMLYLGADRGWVRKELVKDALGDPVLPQGQKPDPSKPRVNNGISGDGRRSTAELGKKMFDMKVDYAVRQIKSLLAGAAVLRSSEATIRYVELALIVAALTLPAIPAAAQLQLARIEGRVVDAQGQALEHALVELEDSLGAPIRAQDTDGAGQFAFGEVAAGRYTLRATISGIDPLLTPLVIDSSLPLSITLKLPLRVSGTVVVEATLGREAVGSLNSVMGTSIALAPVRVRQQGIQDLVATFPGWATEDNGLLHSRGVDDGFLYVIDGVPVYERLDQLLGVGPDLSTVESVNVLTGYVPAEFGHKAGGVIDIRTRAAAARWSTALDIERATQESTGGAVSAGGSLGHATTLRIGAAGQRSDRFLDPVDPDNFHNRGQSVSTFGQVSSSGPRGDLLNASWGFGNSRFDVPNTAAQEAARQDQRQTVQQAFANVSWQRAWSSLTASQISGYVRRSGAELDGSSRDTPLFADADRSLVRAGAVASVTMQRGAHLVKLGGEAQGLTLDEAFSFFVTSRRQARAGGFGEAIVEFDDDDPFTFAGRETPSLLSLFVQDEWQAGPRVTVSGGVRFDRSTMLIARQQLSPRAGLAYRLGEHTVARASVSRFFQPPQPENLLLSSSEAARVLSPFAEDGEVGGADVEPERQWAFEAGVEHWIGRRVRFDMAAWHRAVTNAADPNVFAGTTIIFPNAVATGRAQGVDVRVEMPRHGGWSAYANAGIGKVVQRGPITGGLFLEDEIGELGEGAEFTPDHDQRIVIGSGLTWMHARSGLTLSLAGRYESGTPIERGDEELDELAERPGAERVDFARGRVKPRTVVNTIAELPVWRSQARSIRLRVSGLNLFDDEYAYNFGNPFSGTHFGAPRSVAVSLRAEF